jgi:hypothetical protein
MGKTFNSKWPCCWLPKRHGSSCLRCSCDGSVHLLEKHVDSVVLKSDVLNKYVVAFETICVCFRIVGRLDSSLCGGSNSRDSARDPIIKVLDRPGFYSNVLNASNKFNAITHHPPVCLFQLFTQSNHHPSEDRRAILACFEQSTAIRT